MFYVIILAAIVAIAIAFAFGGGPNRIGAGGAGAPAPLANYDPSQRVLDLIAQGQKIEAIKQVREETGWGLRDSKDFVERISPRG